QAAPSRLTVPVPSATPRRAAVRRSAASLGLDAPSPRRGVAPRVPVATSGGSRLRGGAHLALPARLEAQLTGGLGEEIDLLKGWGRGHVVRLTIPGGHMAGRLTNRHGTVQLLCAKNSDNGRYSHKDRPASR